MPCYSPLKGYMAQKVNESGKRSVSFDRKAGFVDRPVELPCGRCIGCRIDKSKQWAARCAHEARMHEHNCFITLTYDNDNLPLDLSVDKRHYQLFMKRLRKKFGADIRFYASGEYGEQGKRPHYHAILFGFRFTDLKVHHMNHLKQLVYISDTLTKLWGLGHATVAEFSYQTAAYTARYVMKKIHGPDAQEHEEYTRLNPVTGELYQVQPEFALMSRRPGIGATWYEKYKAETFPSDFIVINGKRHPVPKYYLSKLKDEDPETHENIKRKRVKAMRESVNNTPDRLAVREDCHLAKIKRLKRSL